MFHHSDKEDYIPWLETIRSTTNSTFQFFSYLSELVFHKVVLENLEDIDIDNNQRVLCHEYIVHSYKLQNHIDQLDKIKENDKSRMKEWFRIDSPGGQLLAGVCA